MELGLRFESSVEYEKLKVVLTTFVGIVREERAEVVVSKETTVGSHVQPLDWRKKGERSLEVEKYRQSCNFEYQFVLFLPIMPLSEFLRMARGKLESGQQKPCQPDFSRGENELVELVWENGQIMMQGHLSRVTTNPTRQSLPSETPRFREAKFGRVESILNDISPIVPSNDLDINQDDEMAPWLSYPIDVSLPQDYCSQLLPEISGVTGLTPNSARNSFVSPEKRSRCDQSVSNLHDGGNSLKGSSSRARALCSWGSPSDPSLRSGISDIISNNTSNLFGSSAQGRDMVNDLKMERPNIGLSVNNTNFLNFSTFSKPSTLVKANPTNPDAIHASVASGVERIEVKEKGSSNIERLNITQKDVDFNANSRQAVAKAPKESCLPERIENLTSMKNDKPLILSNTGSSTKGVPDGERTVEPMVASSSVGSGNSADRVSCEQTHNSKRKFLDLEDSECRSDDIATESVGVKKPTSGRGGGGSKRTRAAEVHNLSERRRRDRINEKMRALQELIPNCNKADKASMLDEAIEYLKTLQLQVQIMSMGAGLCMPPMMFPTGMQHMHPHFSPMGVGMGMGMGFGMSMLDMNGGSPLFPVPPMQGVLFPSPMSGPTNFPRIPGQNIPLYGHACHGLPNAVPRPPVIPLTGRPPVTSAIGLSGSRVRSQSEVPSTSPVMNSECNAEARSSIDNRSNQPKATNKVLVQPAAVQENKQATDVKGFMDLGFVFTEEDSNSTSSGSGSKLAGAREFHGSGSRGYPHGGSVKTIFAGTRRFSGSGLWRFRVLHYPIPSPKNLCGFGSGSSRTDPEPARCHP
ncbi:hypothetical protein BUALT_Bualt15G0106000 [Buddleja alternifolia]|uniref:BHLH domain-containing protein n=1 Tax=Buddleja alternifolia TaxID=168488 RepID=A0AAV6WKS0_9LAMI|nr:hypothetical protein BUALT_Bualt15G0106000 [Buddleja alternifolia]